MKCTDNRIENLREAERLVRAAASEGAQIILLPELFEFKYFCQQRRYDFYSLAEPVSENAAVRLMSSLAKELSVVIPVSFYERDVNRLFNSVAMIDADGSVMGVYRKTHIPDDHFYQEKFYFTPGNTGFTVWQTRYAAVGVIGLVAVVIFEFVLQVVAVLPEPYRHPLGTVVGVGKLKPQLAEIGVAETEINSETVHIHTVLI